MRTYFFGCIHKLITRFPRLVVFLSFLIAAGAGMYGVNNMEMITDQDRLLSEDLEYHSRYIEFMDTFGDLEFLYVVIEGNEKEEMVSFADTLAARLRRSPDVQNVIYEFHTNWVKDYALLYSSQDDLTELQTELRLQKDDIHSLFETRSIDEILREINDKLKTPQETVEGDSSDFRAQLQTLLDALDGQPNPDFARFSELEERIREQDKTEYMWSDRGNLLLMFVLPAKDYTTLSVIERPLQRIREDIWLTEQEIPTVKAGLTGRPALQADEMSTTNADMLRASLIALVGVTLLFSLFFRELIRPVFAVLALLAALGWTYGFVAFTLGHLNLLSLVFALVLIGLGVDFGIHFLHRYQEELQKSSNASLAVEAALFHVGGGIVTGAVTSSVAFLIALTTDFQGLAELGYVAGAGILFCLVAMLVTLPALLIWYDHHFRQGTAIPSPFHFFGLRHVSRFPLLMLAGIAIATAILFPWAQNVHFNDNLLELQAKGLESVQYEQKLIHESEHSTWYCAFICDSLEELREKEKTIKAQSTVATTDSLSDILPKPSPQKNQRLGDIRSVLNSYEEHASYIYVPNLTISDQLVDTIYEMLISYRQAQMAGQTEAKEEEKKLFTQLQDLADALSGSTQEVTGRLERANRLLLEEPRSNIRSLKTLAEKETVPLDALPEIFHTLYIGKNNSLLIMAFPKENIWETHAMQAFVDDMRHIDPHVTGTPIQVYESSRLMKRSFYQIALFSYVAVAVFVFLDFLSFSALLYILIPLTLGVLWMVELMGLSGLNLNLANFFAIPILIGIGVDDAVHFFHRYKEDHDVEKSIYTTGTTLLLTTLTTSIGFGSLMLASHKGLQTLGMLMALGTATYWFACVVFLPAVIKIVTRVRKKTAQENK